MNAKENSPIDTTFYCDTLAAHLNVAVKLFIPMMIYSLINCVVSVKSYNQK